MVYIQTYMYTYIDVLTAESINLSSCYFSGTIFPVIISIGKLFVAWEAINSPNRHLSLSLDVH